LLQSELKHLGRMEDYYLHHEHLEEHNQPLYFHQFATKLAVNGLQYLGDSDFSTMVSTNFSGDVAKTLNQLGAHDIIQMEQYMDFVRCRYFRKSLICRSSVKLNRSLTPGVVKGLLLASNAVSEPSEAALDPAQNVTFRTSAGYKLTCRSPLTKVALRILQRDWPLPVRFADLVVRSKAESSKQGFPADEATAEEFLAGEILTGMAAGVVEWRLGAVSFTTEIGTNPATTQLARLQAERGYKVTSLRGESVTLDEIHRQTLKLLDGTRDLAQLAEALLALLKSGELVLHRDTDKARVTDEAEMRSLLAAALDKVLTNLARMALLARLDPKRKPSPQPSLAG